MRFTRFSGCIANHRSRGLKGLQYQDNITQRIITTNRTVEIVLVSPHSRAGHIANLDDALRRSCPFTSSEHNIHRQRKERGRTCMSMRHSVLVCQNFIKRVRKEINHMLGKSPAACIAAITASRQIIWKALRKSMQI